MEYNEQIKFMLGTHRLWYDHPSTLWSSLHYKISFIWDTKLICLFWSILAMKNVSCLHFTITHSSAKQCIATRLKSAKRCWWCLWWWWWWWWWRWWCWWCWWCLSAGFERGPMVSLSAFLSKEIPKYCANKSQLVSKREIEFHFWKICTRCFPPASVW